MENNFYQEIGKRIQKVRKEHRVSQRELASKIGKKSATYINLIESGKRKISIFGLTKIANALEVPINTFIHKNYLELNSSELLELALISDRQISTSQRKMIMEFIEFIKTRK
ncbi:MAG: helix-turn-helix transcriptional regulator [Candidatus Gracilibacteria bacterium]|nr:helix-turn-helix transcriptional regulator [Candidatus Peregrinibacteria bacterium]